MIKHGGYDMQTSAMADVVHLFKEHEIISEFDKITIGLRSHEKIPANSYGEIK